ncbi:hypothetical protein ACFLZP_02315 [Patescibacteria group bacterium]
MSSEAIRYPRGDVRNLYLHRGGDFQSERAMAFEGSHPNIKRFSFDCRAFKFHFLFPSRFAELSRGVTVRVDGEDHLSETAQEAVLTEVKWMKRRISLYESLTGLKPGIKHVVFEVVDGRSGGGLFSYDGSSIGVFWGMPRGCRLLPFNVDELSEVFVSCRPKIGHEIGHSTGYIPTLPKGGVRVRTRRQSFRQERRMSSLGWLNEGVSCFGEAISPLDNLPVDFRSLPDRKWGEVLRKMVMFQGMWPYSEHFLSKIGMGQEQCEAYALAQGDSMTLSAAEFFETREGDVNPAWYRLDPNPASYLDGKYLRPSVFFAFLLDRIRDDWGVFERFFLSPLQSAMFYSWSQELKGADKASFELNVGAEGSGLLRQVHRMSFDYPEDVDDFVRRTTGFSYKELLLVGFNYGHR